MDCLSDFTEFGKFDGFVRVPILVYVIFPMMHVSVEWILCFLAAAFNWIIYNTMPKYQFSLLYLI